jgi:flagellar hook-basal body complex protein FliE
MSLVAPVAPRLTAPLAHIVAALPAAAPPMPPGGSSFASLLTDGIRSMEAKIGRADTLVKAFALGDGVPVHQVTYALEEARLSVELAMQVRTRLLEGYRELMNMQL